MGLLLLAFALVAEVPVVAVVPVWAPFVPNKLMEYLALGLPVITTDWPAVRLYFDDSAVCYVAPKNARALAEAIMALYCDPARRAALASQGHAVYREKYAWERIKPTYLAVYGAGPPGAGGAGCRDNS